MTRQQAFKIIRKEEITDQEWDEASKVILAAGNCPQCAREGFTRALGRVEPGTADTYEGRECYTCEEFYPTPGQPAFELVPEYDNHSDADPGL